MQGVSLLMGSILEAVMVHSTPTEKGCKGTLALVTLWSSMTWNSRVSKEGGGRNRDAGEGWKEVRKWPVMTSVAFAYAGEKRWAWLGDVWGGATTFMPVCVGEE